MWLVLIGLLFQAQGADGRSAEVDIAVTKVVGSGEPGVAVLVLEKGKVLHKKGYGLANLEHRVRVTPETSFRLASVSKQFTAMGVMILADRGKLSFEDDVRKHIPELPEDDKKRPIRIDDLLHHTSGLPDYTRMMGEFDKPLAQVRNDDVVRLLSKKKLSFSPGTRHRYSNSNYCLLAVIIARISKKSFGTFLREEIFEPLGMKQAAVFEDPAVVIPNRAYGYRKAKGGYRTSHSDLATTGDGAVFLSIDDFVAWDEALRKGKLVKPETLKRSFTPGKLDDGRPHGYGYGWGVARRRGQIVLEHGGGWFGSRTYIRRYVKDGLTIVILSGNDSLDPATILKPVVQAYLGKGR